jgi:phage gp29-like protein
MAQIVDINGNPLSSDTLAEPQTASLGYLQREFETHPSRGLTPYKLSRILIDAELGNLQAQADLFADMEEKDAHIFSEMAKRKQAILTVDYKIVAPANPTPQEQADTDWLNEIVRSIDAMDDMLLSLMDAVGYGYSNVEIGWELVEGQQIPGTLKHVPASWFRLANDNQDELRLRDASAAGAPLQPFGWIPHVHKAKSGHIARCGLHRVLAWPYLFKNYAIRDLAELLEIYGLPIRIGKYPAGAGAKEKATLLHAVTELGHSAAGIIPEGMAIDFVNATASGSAPHLSMNDWSEKSVSKAVLGGTLTSQADGKSSTNALGKVHNGVRHDLLASDVRQIAATIKRYLFYPLLVLNRRNINPRRLPSMVFDVAEPEDFQAFSTALPNLVDIGTPVPVSWVLTKLNIPAAVGNEPVLRRVSKAPGGADAASGLVAKLMADLAGTPPADRLANSLEDQSAQAWQAVLSHVTSLVENAASLPELQSALLAAYSGLPLADLQEVMAQGLVAAQAAGMVDVKAGK